MSIKTTQIDGDISIGRNVSIGGDAKIAGGALVKGNLKVEGWLDARNVKGPNKGVFMTEERMRTAYPRPHDGWWCIVGTTLPGPIYVGEGGEWVATGETGGNPTVEMEQYEQSLADIEEDVAAVEEDVAALQSAVAANTSNIGLLDSDIKAVEEDVAALQSAVAANTSNIGLLDSDIKAVEEDVAALQTWQGALAGGLTVEELTVQSSDPETVYVSITGKAADGSSSPTMAEASIPAATTKTAGVMTAEDKTALNSLSAARRRAYDLTAIAALTTSSTAEEIMAAFKPIASEGYGAVAGTAAVMPRVGDALIASATTSTTTAQVTRTLVRTTYTVLEWRIGTALSKMTLQSNFRAVTAAAEATELTGGGTDVEVAVEMTTEEI